MKALRRAKWLSRAEACRDDTINHSWGYKDLLKKGLEAVETGEDRQELGIEKLQSNFKEIENDAHRSLAGKHSRAVVELRGEVDYDVVLGQITRVLQAHCTRIWLRRMPVTYIQGMSFLAACVVLVSGEEEAGFWLYAHLIEEVLSPFFFCDRPLILGYHADAQIFQELVVQVTPII